MRNVLIQLISLLIQPIYSRFYISMFPQMAYLLRPLHKRRTTQHSSIHTDEVLPIEMLVLLSCLIPSFRVVLESFLACLVGQLL